MNTIAIVPWLGTKGQGVVCVLWAYGPMVDSGSLVSSFEFQDDVVANYFPALTSPTHAPCTRTPTHTNMLQYDHIWWGCSSITLRTCFLALDFWQQYSSQKIFFRNFKSSVRLETLGIGKFWHRIRIPREISLKMLPFSSLNSNISSISDAFEDFWRIIFLTNILLKTSLTKKMSHKIYYCAEYFSGN